VSRTEALSAMSLAAVAETALPALEAPPGAIIDAHEISSQGAQSSLYELPSSPRATPDRTPGRQGAEGSRGQVKTLLNFEQRTSNFENGAGALIILPSIVTQSQRARLWIALS
jgi:hypothetical protein